jgi:hypothetical protein
LQGEILLKARVETYATIRASMLFQGHMMQLGMMEMMIVHSTLSGGVFSKEFDS